MVEFYKKRLKIAQNLLAPRGVIFINIDETQIGCLILLCEEMFGEKNVDVLIWPKIDPKYDKNRVEKPFNTVKSAHEYVVLCYKNKSITRFKTMKRLPRNSGLNDPEQELFMESILYNIGTTSSAKDELFEIFNDRNIFSTPKPRKMMKEFVRVACRSDGIILDFFAGSGTTGHAVMDLNNEDGGNRKFILITNNENNICRKITYERIIRVIKKEHYKESLKFYEIKSIKNKT